MSKNKQIEEEELLEKRKNEILGILLIALALFSGLSLFSQTTGILTQTTGVIGNILSNIYRQIAGIGSYLFPVLLIIWGITLIRLKHIVFNSKLIGFIITYTMFLAIIHLYLYPNFPFNAALEKEAGGIVGGIISWLLSELFGVTGTFIILGALILIGFLLWFDILLNSMMKSIIEFFRNITKKIVIYYNNIIDIIKKYRNKVKNKKNKENVPQEIAAVDEQDYQDIYLEENEDEETYNYVQQQLEEKDDIIDIDNEEINIDNENNESDEYKLPPLKLLKSSGNKKIKLDNKTELLEKTLESFGVKAQVKEVSHGPKITRYEVQPSTGVKVSKIVNLADDIALALAASDVRIEAPIPGKAAVGIEVPHNGNIFVRVRDLLSSKSFKKADSKLTLALGKGIDGQPLLGNLASMPHLLVAGATGSGKSVCINTFIASILYEATPDQVKLILVDPKKVELSNYKGLPHLFTPVVTDPKKAANVLKLVVEEMEKRYELFSESKSKGIDSYNKKVDESEKLPYIVVIIDELSDLMMVAANEVEDNICRLAQMSRAAGIHLIIATQRPSVDVITGLIKANIPSRISFAVSSQTDSRTILDMGGAEKLLGNGDMLYSPVDNKKPQRIQGAFISNEEINNLVHFVKNQSDPEFEVELEDINEINIATDKEKDEFYEKAVKLVVKYRASISMLQRKLRVGHSRAARMIDTMEEEGIVGPYAGSKPREVLISEDELPEFIEGIEAKTDNEDSDSNNNNEKMGNEEKKKTEDKSMISDKK